MYEHISSHRRTNSTFQGLGVPLNGLTPPHVYAYPKSGPGFRTWYVFAHFLCSVEHGNCWLLVLLKLVELLNHNLFFSSFDNSKVLMTSICTDDCRLRSREQYWNTLSCRYHIQCIQSDLLGTWSNKKYITVR